MNYDGLQTAIADYFRRGDLSSRIKTGIEEAESMLFREISVKSVAVSASGTTTNGLITLPADFGSVVRLTVTSNGTERNLSYIANPDDSADSGQSPTGYAVQGAHLRLFPSAGTGTAYTLYYTPKLQNLSATVATNWLLDNAFDLYKYAACLAVAMGIKDNAETAKLQGIVAPLIASTRNYAERFGQPTAGRMQIRVRR